MRWITSSVLVVFIYLHNPTTAKKMYQYNKSKIHSNGYHLYSFIRVDYKCLPCRAVRVRELFGVISWKEGDLSRKGRAFILVRRNHNFIQLITNCLYTDSESCGYAHILLLQEG
jgi:hypothetical protein